MILQYCILRNKTYREYFYLEEMFEAKQLCLGVELHPDCLLIINHFLEPSMQCQAQQCKACQKKFHCLKCYVTPFPSCATLTYGSASQLLAWLWPWLPNLMLLIFRWINSSYSILCPFRDTVIGNRIKVFSDFNPSFISPKLN